MTTVNINDFLDGFCKTFLAFSGQGKEGKSKNGEDYCVKKIVPFEEETKARRKPFVLKFKNVNSFGLKKFETKAGSAYFSFSLIIEEEKAKKNLERIILACEDLAKTRKDFKKLSFEKFSPMRGDILYCRVQYNPKAKRFYTKFMKGHEQINPKVLLEEGCLVDAAVKIDSVFCKKKKCYLHLNLVEVRHKKNIAINSFLDLSSESEDEED